LITYLPFDLQNIKPLENINASPNLDTIYLWSGKLVNITHRKGNKPFLILDFQGNQTIKAYLFSLAKYTMANLVLNKTYQLLLAYRKGFWTIDKFALQQETLTTHPFILGKMILRDYLMPKYSKIGVLQSSYFNQIFRRLKPQDYILNLKGLLPQNDLIPEYLDLSKIHSPSSLIEYENTLHSWIALKVFLRTSLDKFINMESKSKPAKSGPLNMNLLKHLSSNLPFELSPTQKTTIWDILQDITVVE
jgi:RecG-like helicase